MTQCLKTQYFIQNFILDPTKKSSVLAIDLQKLSFIKCFEHLKNFNIGSLQEKVDNLTFQIFSLQNEYYVIVSNKIKKQNIIEIERHSSKTFTLMHFTRTIAGAAIGIQRK